MENLENKGLISVVIPVYNCEKFLNQCVDSILNQTYQNFEIILVCDKGKDNSEKICEEYANNHAMIKYIFREDAGGVSSARNCGIDNISPNAEFICFVDADDWVETNYLEVLHGNLIKHSADISICSWKWETRKKIHFIQTKKQICKIFDREQALIELLTYNKFSGALWHKLLKVSIMGDLKFDEKTSYGEDLKFSFDYIKKCEKIIWTNQKLYHYIYNKNSIVNSRFSTSRLSLLFMMENLIKECDKSNKNISAYAKSLFFLQGVETLYFIKKTNYKDSKTKEYVIKIIKDYAKSYKQIKNNYNFFRRLGLIGAKLLGVK